MDEEDAAERYAAEIRAATVQRDDPCTTPVWRSAGPLPAPQWAAPSDLTDDELHDAIHHLALMSGREPLPRDADSAALAAEMAAIRQELGPEGVLTPWR
ncbi:hypothetical protein [Methylobacterium nigriterrae]|uniref:hypothetical protein n=1 Tax=Methylobacterium nigriterrae TaxID=3127512 RepID=UPI003013DA10